MQSSPILWSSGTAGPRMEQIAGAKTYYAILFLILIVMLAPMWSINYPGMIDYPNHMARCYILGHYHDNPLWQQRYVVDRTPLPNLAIDLIVAPLSRFLPLLVAGKLFLTLTAVLYVIGCSEVGRAVTGRLNWLALLCAFTFYNKQLLEGFVNFVFAIGVFLCILAFWLRVRNRLAAWSFLLLCLFSVVAFLAHLSAVVFLGVSCLTIALLDYAGDRKPRAFFAKVAWLVCPLLLLAAFFKGSAKAGHIYWSTLLSPKLGTFCSAIRSYSSRLDGVVGVALLICILAFVKGARIHRLAVVGLLFIFLFFITPDGLLTVRNLPERYAVPAFLMLLLSIEPAWGRWQKAAFAVALVVTMVRMGNITANWLSINRESEHVLAMGRVLPEKARVFVFIPPMERNHPGNPQLRLSHLIQYWTVSKEADVSSLFALPGQQPIVFRDPSCHGPYSVGSENVGCIGKFDFVWTYDPAPTYRQQLSRIATPAATWNYITLWRLNHPDTSALRNP